MLFRSKGREMFSGLRDASDAQRQAMRSQFEKLAADTDAKVTGILSEAQNKRLGEIAVQVQGAHVLLDKKIAEQLQLTDAQTQSINDLVEAEREEQMGRFADLRDLPQDERRAKFEQLRNEGEEARKATDELILAELSTEQAEQFKAMAGEPFEFDRNELFRGMFAGPGGPGGPRGEGGPRGQRGGRGEGRPNRPSNE